MDATAMDTTVMDAPSELQAQRRTLRALFDRPHADVLIIGGGINGIATFRDLALQGVDVALVDAGDFVSGASAASSHMIHGGIRYLENGEFRLVHEAVTERNALLRTAAHYVRPLQTTIPIFSTFSGLLSAPLRFLRHGKGKPRERGALLIKVGLLIYDSFSRGGGRVPRHSFHGRRKSLALLPRLNPAVRYTATYWDASLHDPERLALDVLHDGVLAGAPGTAAAAGSPAVMTGPTPEPDAQATARAANYVAAVGAADGAVVLRDALTGEEHSFAASVVVNASGPWTDLTNAALGEATRYMGGTKGSHIVLDHPELYEATAGRELFFEHSDGRIVLIYPLKDRVLVGTTDLEHDMQQPIRCTPAEVDYFFALARQVFPDIAVSRDQIVYRFAGVRPLPGHGDLAPGFVSRDYRIEQAPLPGSGGAATLLSLVGGKWTTFRASAEHLADRVLAVLDRPRRVTTKGVPIGGGLAYPATERRRLQWIDDHVGTVERQRVAVLLDRYGTRATEVIEAIEKATSDRPLEHTPAYSSAEIEHLVRTEQVVHLADVVMRRTGIVFAGGASEPALDELAHVVGGVLGWGPERIIAEVEHARREVDRAVEPAEAAREREPA